MTRLSINIFKKKKCSHSIIENSHSYNKENINIKYYRRNEKLTRSKIFIDLSWSPRVIVYSNEELNHKNDE